MSGRSTFCFWFVFLLFWSFVAVPLRFVFGTRALFVSIRGLKVFSVFAPAALSLCVTTRLLPPYLAAINDVTTTQSGSFTGEPAQPSTPLPWWLIHMSWEKTTAIVENPKYSTVLSEFFLRVLSFPQSGRTPPSCCIVYRDAISDSGSFLQTVLSVSSCWFLFAIWLRFYELNFVRKWLLPLSQNRQVTMC